MILLWVTVGCTSADQWWENEDANPYAFEDGGESESDGERDGEGGDEEPGVFGLLFPDGEQYSGECGVEMSGCAWYGLVTGLSTDACAECDFAVTISTEEMEVFASDGCPVGFSPDDFSNRTFTLGFAGETTWLNQDGEWLEWGYYFQEGEYHIWFVPFE